MRGRVLKLKRLQPRTKFLAKRRDRYISKRCRIRFELPQRRFQQG
jgi:hypothetical protein